MIIKRKMTFDPACLELAEHFLEDEAGINSKSKVEDLAATIQSAVESWIEYERYSQEPRETGDAWTGGFADNH